MAHALPTSTTSYLAKFGINGTCLPDDMSMQCTECGHDTGTDPDTDTEHASCRESRRAIDV